MKAGADVIFNTCSSVGDIALEAKNSLPVPLVKIDDSMARKAVESGPRIGILAQGSMTRMEKTLAEITGKMVLSSPLMGLLEVKSELAIVV